MRIKLNRRVLGAAMSVLAVVPLGMAAAPAHAASETEVSHNCRVFGSDQHGNKAVDCIDLWKTVLSSKYSLMIGENEEYCENSANAIVECAAIREQGEIAWRQKYDGKTVTEPGLVGECGARWGHSRCGVRRVTNEFDASAEFLSGTEVWAVDLGPEIVLPQSGKTIVGSNFATSPHAHA